jgi:hypothetical protein
MCISKRIEWIFKKSHREKKFFLHFFEISSSDMKNFVECTKEFFAYFNALETRGVLPFLHMTILAVFLQFCFSFSKVSKLYAVSPSCLLCLFFRGVWRSLDLLGMKHISSANLQPFKRASALVEAKVIFLSPVVSYLVVCQ